MSKQHSDAERLKQEAMAVSVLRDHLQSMGHADEVDDLLDVALEGETDFREMVDAFLAAEANTAALIAAISDRIDGLRERRERLEKRSQYLRGLLQVGLETSGLGKLETATATLSIKHDPPRAIITEEADIPASYWRPQPPKVDQAALTKIVRERAKALAAAEAIRDPQDRKLALVKVENEYPPIPGVVASNPIVSIAIRRR